MAHTIQVTEETLREKLERALLAQKELYLQLLALAREQSGHVASGESEALMAVLSARSRLIEEVAPLDQKLQPFKGRWQEVLDGLAAGDRATLGTSAIAAVGARSRCL